MEEEKALFCQEPFTIQKATIDDITVKLCLTLYFIGAAKTFFPS